MTNAGTDNLEQRITQLLRENLAIDIPSPETDLIAMGALDSLALVELLLRIEEKIGIAISIEELDLQDLRSVRSIGALLSRRLAPK
ncbi:MAG: acyl carrier protein [Planctomycetota bacterium]|jgi:acyl carrier protein